ncbi:type II toxin-antitoxin system Phd/YefM family antitoxin [Thalassospira lucentensis]|uniref:type II toxin-antitoxin system Phd/YefM family antitoxin n=1 Tax=Thalassospira lucentensis TaxID=168935 RepID=UPI003AA94FB6|tara:strand:- start:623 stop:880 length:258 start_codon:yes stop_codon:yes gene_type:complete
MGITTISSREFNQDTSSAKKASNSGPVVITDRGKPSHVLLSIEEYQKLTGNLPSIVELLAMPADTGDFAFDPQPAHIDIKSADLS